MGRIEGATASEAIKAVYNASEKCSDSCRRIIFEASHFDLGKVI